jgi:hypothetical protein
MNILDIILSELPNDVDMLTTFKQVSEEMRGDDDEVKADDVINNPKIAQVCLDKLTAIASTTFNINTGDFLDARADTMTNISILQRELRRQREQHIHTQEDLSHYNITCQNMYRSVLRLEEEKLYEFQPGKRLEYVAALMYGGLIWDHVPAYVKKYYGYALNDRGTDCSKLGKNFILFFLIYLLFVYVRVA